MANNESDSDLCEAILYEALSLETRGKLLRHITLVRVAPRNEQLFKDSLEEPLPTPYLRE